MGNMSAPIGADLVTLDPFKEGPIIGRKAYWKIK